MSELQYKEEPHTYEVIWTSGHIEHIKANLVVPAKSSMMLLDDDNEGHWKFIAWVLNGKTDSFTGKPDYRSHLLLAIHAKDLQSVRNLTLIGEAPPSA
jgi:hypothetical protein